MTEDQYLSLCEKYFKGDCTPEDETLINKYQDAEGLPHEHLADVDTADKERLRALLYNKIQISLHPQETNVFKIRRWSYVAAAATIVLAIGIYFAGVNKHKNDALIAKTRIMPIKDIQPGSNKAILTLSNGSQIVLDDTKNGVLSKQGNLAISKSASGIIVKNDNTNQNLASNNALNTITIPRGGKYNIQLPDGTQVWLNSSSSLTFPTAFAGPERKVILKGEAYFEVAKNKAKPFKVDVNGKQVVEVLGTHFNINAYADEQNTTTTLLEGSVKINYHDKAVLIKPGQMAINNLGPDVTVKDANIEEVMAWKNDYFIFNNENITSIMKQVSRWYDVDIAFKGNMSNINFDGNYSRAKGLSSLLKNIELVDKVRFIVEERRITVIAK